MKCKLKPNLINKNDGFIVQTMYILFYCLERISVFFWIRKIFGKNKDSFVNTYIFPEIWAVGNVIFCIISMKILSINNNSVVAWILLIYSLLRVVELFVYQINVLFFHRLNQYYWINETKKTKKRPKKTDSYVLKSATRTIILLIFNMVEYILQFSVMYMAIGFIFNMNIEPLTIFDSFKMFMNTGDFEIKGNINKGQSILMRLIYFETIIGIFMNILCIARFINEVPQINQIDK